MDMKSLTLVQLGGGAVWGLEEGTGGQEGGLCQWRGEMQSVDQSVLTELQPLKADVKALTDTVLTVLIHPLMEVGVVGGLIWPPLNPEEQVWEQAPS